MIHKMISLLGIFVLLVVFPGGASRAATPAIDQPPQPESASLSLPGGPGVLSIPAAAFVPADPACNYENHGRYLKYFGGCGDTSIFRAALPLPHGTTLTRVNFALYDDSTTKSATADLMRYELLFHMYTIATYTTPGSGGWYQSNSSETETIQGRWFYWIEVELPISSNTTGDKVWGGNMTIYYSPSGWPLTLSIPGNAFKPMQDGYDYSTNATGLSHAAGSSGDTTGGYLAQVNLPDGAVVTRLALTYYNEELEYTITARLQRSVGSGSYSNMAEVSNPEDVVWYETTVSTTTIVNAIIDNVNYAYWVSVSLPEDAPFHVYLVGVSIDYSLPTGHPGYAFSLSTAAFTGFFDDFDYENHARWLFHLAGEGGSTDPQVYLAPVYLPNGSIVSNIYFGFYDGSTTKSGSAYLVATRLGTNYEMASGTPSSNPGYIWLLVTGDNIEYAKIDNDTYAYFVYYVLPPATVPAPPGSDDVIATAVRIYYRPPGYAYLPLAMK